ncbi:MAG: TonB-dependent receptor, partial [Thermoanaerobaculia bacterium]|nr:TonB-dependent receptor [Thermoanaerobaculia bacterium]
MRTAGPGSQTSILLRGANSTHTLVLVDGVRMNSPTGGGFDFADLTPDNLERIEILRGPQSTLYGSEAIGGVISITTRRGEGPPSGTLAAESGSEDHRRLQGSVMGSRGGFDYSLGVSQIATEGFSAANEARGNPEADGYQNLAISSRLGFALPRDGRLISRCAP